MKPRVNLFYLSGNTTGGWVTYTAHLIYGLREIADVYLHKIGNNSEKTFRSFGYGVHYRNVSIEEACVLVKNSPSAITAVQKNFREQAKALLNQGSWIVVHDPAEFKNIELEKFDKQITIRKAVKEHLPSSTFIPHPYQRTFKGLEEAQRKYRSCSICRIDFDKNTHILLEANRLLEEEDKIQIRGFENRLYTRFKLVPKFPEWVQSVNHYPREKETAVNICKDAMYCVDMSLIKGDGGGTQYSFLEAMDAGCVNIVNDGWIRENDEMIPFGEEGANCLTTATGEGLASIISSRTLEKEVRSLSLKGSLLLTRHNPLVIAKKFLHLIKE